MIDPKKYLDKISEPHFEPIAHIAIIGAGISGLFAGRTLQDHGLQVTVFEKSRGVGGRMATRRVEDGLTFDHGAQYFTARDPSFASYVQAWIEQGIVAKWPDSILGRDQKIVVLKDVAIQSESTSEDRFVGVPGMNSICKHLADPLNVRTDSRIARVLRTDDGVELFDAADASRGKFDCVVVSAPAAQAAELLADFPALSNQISNQKMNPCWAAMASFAEPITDQWAGAFLHESFLSWAARNSTKPGRNHEAEHLVIHSSPDWTSNNWERDPEAVAKEMLAEFWKVAGLAPRPHEYLQAHRWKYAIPVDPPQVRCFADDSAVAIACGDWASGSRVEGAFLSGMSAAGRVLGKLKPRTL